MDQSQIDHPLLYAIRPLHRCLISFLFALVTFFLVPDHWPILLKILSGWLSFAIVYTTICWFAISKMNVPEISKRAGEEDGSVAFVFTFIVLATIGCFVGVLFIITGDKKQLHESTIVPISLACVISSWVLVHTIYTFHYARMFYRTNTKGSGLDFPGGEKPDYMDFAYFSFVMGCTFQVSDVEITSKKIRHVALFHGLLSFALNTYVIALTINIVAGLIN